MRDYYEILGVERDAVPDEIKKSYRQLALKYHPDRNGGDTAAEAKFKEATEAYEILRDAEKRAAYDRFGHAGVKRGAASAGFGGFGFEEALNIFMRDFGGFGGFEEIFTGRRSGSQVQRGKDLRVRLKLSLGEVATGVRKTLRLKVLEACDTCSGSGAAPGSEPVTCATCGGAGEVRRMQRSVFGQMVTASICPSCQGEGHVIREPCEACRGDGRRRVERTEEVEIPAGVETDNYLTLRGKGHAGPRGGPHGDVLVILEVEQDARFERQGADLVCELPITFSQAALGAELEVPTVLATERLRVPAGIQAGEVLTLRGRGLPRLRGGGSGDQHVRVHVWTPTQVSSEQEELFRQLAQIETPLPEEGRGKPRFWDRVKEVFAA